MSQRRIAIYAASIVFGLFVVGCAIPTEDPFAADPSTATVDPETTGADQSPPASWEDVYNNFDAMGEYAQAVRTEFIEPWMRETFPGMPLPRLNDVEPGESGWEGCTDYSGGEARYTTESFEYCPADGVVYVGWELLWDFFVQTGDAGPAVGIAHEYGHHIQAELGVFDLSTPEDSIDVENQADCIAGAWVYWLARQPDEPLEEEDDLADIDALFPLIASAEDEPDRDHGTLEERKAAFEDGFRSGISACDLPR